MDARRGLVLEINKGKAVLLCPGGDFRSAVVPRGAHWVVGQEVGLEALVTPAPAWRGWLGVRPAAMALAFVLALVAVGVPVAGYVYSRPLPAVAYLSVDINPSFEVGVDVRGRTTSVTALNDDAAKLLENRTFSGPAAKVVSQLVNLSIGAGYLGTPDALVLITSAAAGTNAAQPDKGIAVAERALAQAKASVQSTLAKEQKTNQVQDLKLDSETREGARAEGISPGKFAILLAAQKENLEVTVDDMKSASVAKAINAAGGKVGEVIGHAAQVKDFRPWTREYLKKAKEKGNDKDKGQGTQTPPAKPDADKGKGTSPGGEAPAKGPSVAVSDKGPGTPPKDPGKSDPPPGVPRAPTANGEEAPSKDQGQGDSRAGGAGYTAGVSIAAGVSGGPWEQAKDTWITTDRQERQDKQDTSSKKLPQEPEQQMKDGQSKGDKEHPGQTGSPQNQPGTGDGAGKRGR